MSLCLHFRSPIKLEDINNQYTEYFYNNPSKDTQIIFETALKNIYGSIIHTDIYQSKTVISFDNPSIKDFMINKIANSNDLIAECAKLCLNIQNCNELCELSKNKILSSQFIRNIISDLYIRIIPNDNDVTFYEKIQILKYIYITNESKLINIRHDLLSYFSSEIGNTDISYFSSLFHYLSEFLSANDDLKVFHKKYIEYIKAIDFDTLDLSSIESISSIIEYTNLNINNDDFNLIKEKVLVIDDYYNNLSKSDYSKSEYAWFDFSDLQHIANVFQVKFSSEYHIQSIAEELDEDRNEMLINADYDDLGYDRSDFEYLEKEEQSYRRLDQLRTTYQKEK